MKVPVASMDGCEKRVTGRYASIDIFRGTTMAVMIFVNDLDGVHGLPWWTHHAKSEINVMTYVDMVFPFFLFALGMSMPIAIEHRLRKTPRSCCCGCMSWHDRAVWSCWGSSLQTWRWPIAR